MNDVKQKKQWVKPESEAVLVSCECTAYSEAL